MFMSSYTIGKGKHQSIRYLKLFFPSFLFKIGKKLYYLKGIKNKSYFPGLVNLRVAFVKSSNLWVERP